MLLLAGLSLVVCCLQFYIGRRIGRACGDKIAGAQGLGQKNTVLAIWMALTYLHPIASVAPAAYVAWQNTINSAQLYIKAKRDAEERTFEASDVLHLQKLLSFITKFSHDPLSWHQTACMRV